MSRAAILLRSGRIPVGEINGAPVSQVATSIRDPLAVVGTVEAGEAIEWVYSQDGGSTWELFDPTGRVRDLVWVGSYDEQFNTAIDTAVWELVNSAGENGNGIFDPTRVVQAAGRVTITGVQDELNSSVSSGRMEMVPAERRTYGQFKASMSVETDSTLTFRARASMRSRYNNVNSITPAGGINFASMPASTAATRDPVQTVLNANVDGLTNIATTINYPASNTHTGYGSATFEDFDTVGSYDGGAFGGNWSAYDSAGNAGFGLRDTSAVSIVDTTAQPLLVGDPPSSNGKAAQITASWDGSNITSGIVQLTALPISYGRVRFRAKATGDATNQMSPVILMWPDDDIWPGGGEIDIWEGYDARDDLNPMKTFLHRENPAAPGVDQQIIPPLSWATPDIPYNALGTDWHTYEMVWLPNRIDITVDDTHTQTLTTDPDWIPSGPMKFSIQLDAWSNTTLSSDVHMWVDWVSIEEATFAVSSDGVGQHEYCAEWSPNQVDYYRDGDFLASVVNGPATPTPHWPLHMGVTLDAQQPAYIGPDVEAVLYSASIADLLDQAVLVKARLVSNTSIETATATVTFPGIGHQPTFTVDLPDSTERDSDEALAITASWDIAMAYQVQQWDPGGSGNWANSTGTGSSGTGTTTSFGAAVAPLDGWKYRVVLTNTYGDKYVSNETTLDVTQITNTLDIEAITYRTGNTASEEVPNPIQGTGGTLLFLSIGPGPSQSAGYTFTTPTGATAIPSGEYGGSSFVPRYKTWTKDDEGEDTFTMGGSTADTTVMVVVGLNQAIDGVTITPTPTVVGGAPGASVAYPSIASLVDDLVVAFGISQTSDTMTAGPSGYTEEFNSTGTQNPRGVALHSKHATGTTTAPGNSTWGATAGAHIQFVVNFSPTAPATPTFAKVPAGQFTVYVDPEIPSTWNASRANGQLIVAGNRFNTGSSTDGVQAGTGYGLSFDGNSEIHSFAMQDGDTLRLGPRTVTGLQNTSTALLCKHQWVNGNGYNPNLEGGFSGNPSGQLGVNLSTAISGSFATDRTYFDGTRTQLALIPTSASDPKAIRATFGGEGGDRVYQMTCFRIENWMRDSGDSAAGGGVHASGNAQSPWTSFIGSGAMRIITRDQTTPWVQGNNPPGQVRVSVPITAGDVGDWWSVLVDYTIDPLDGHLHVHLNKNGAGWNQILNVNNGYGLSYANNEPNQNLFYSMLLHYYTWHRYTNGPTNNWASTYGNVRTMAYAFCGTIVNPVGTTLQDLRDHGSYFLGG